MSIPKLSYGYEPNATLGTRRKAETDGISKQGQPWLPRPSLSLLVLHPKVKWETRHISVPQWTHNQSGKWKYMPLLIKLITAIVHLLPVGLACFLDISHSKYFEWYLGKKKEFQATERCSWEFYRAGYAQWLYWVYSVCVCVYVYLQRISNNVSWKLGLSFEWPSI